MKVIVVPLKELETTLCLNRLDNISNVFCSEKLKEIESKIYRYGESVG